MASTRIINLPDAGDPSNDDFVMLDGNTGGARKITAAAFATATQGGKADTAVQPDDLNFSALASAAAKPSRFIMHRGGSALAPENTMAAYTNAYALGARQVECDMQPTLDGGVVLHHDDRLERTTNGCGAPPEWTLGRLRQLSAALPCDPKRIVHYADRYPYDADGQPTCPVATWDELLTYSVGRFDRVWAEFKGLGWTQERVHAVVDDILARGLEQLVVLQSYFIEYLQWVRERTMVIAVEMTAASPGSGATGSDEDAGGSGEDEDSDGGDPNALIPAFTDAAARALIAPTAALCGERYLLLSWRSCIGDATLVRDVRAAGVDVVAYTVNATSTMANATRALRRMGVSLIMTDTWLGER